jgi:putative transcriptional regulator
LVASPSLRDPNFFRSVVLIIEHTDDGALGLVLNRPSNSSLKELWEKATQEHCSTTEPLYIGGPVSGTLTALHTQPHISDIDVVPGVYFSTQAAHLQTFVQGGDSCFRIFAGHSGWAGGQLESEMADDSWITTAANAEYIFYGDPDLWEKVLGDMFIAAVTKAHHIKHIPDDPTVN